MKGGNDSLNTTSSIQQKELESVVDSNVCIIDAQDVLDLVNDGYTPVAADATKAQRNVPKETRKEDQKALFYIHQCVDMCVFEKIIGAMIVETAWDRYTSEVLWRRRLSEVTLQFLRKKYENLRMKDNEKVPDYISRVTVVTNEMKACGETLSEQVIVEKVLRYLTPRFDYIVVVIEHSKDTNAMRIEELKSSLEVKELRLIERTLNESLNRL